MHGPQTKPDNSRGDAAMEDRLKRKLADGAGRVLFDHALQTELVRLGTRYLTAGNDVGYLLRTARADIQRMRTIPVPQS
jgi:hypothetical protein